MTVSSELEFDAEHPPGSRSPQHQVWIRLCIAGYDRVGERYPAHAGEEQLAHVVERLVAAVHGPEHRGDDGVNRAPQAAFGHGELIPQIVVGACRDPQLHCRPEVWFTKSGPELRNRVIYSFAAGWVWIRRLFEPSFHLDDLLVRKVLCGGDDEGVPGGEVMQESAAGDAGTLLDCDRRGAAVAAFDEEFDRCVQDQRVAVGTPRGP